MPQRCHECCWTFALTFAFVAFAIVISTCLRVKGAPEMSRVFLGNLPSDCRVEDIEDFFRDFGKVMAFASIIDFMDVIQVRNVLIKHGKFGFAEFDRDRLYI